MKAVAVYFAGLALAAWLGVIATGFLAEASGAGKNTLAGTPQPTGAPDLVVARLTVGQQGYWEGDCTVAYGARVWVKNVGTAKAGASTTAVSAASGGSRSGTTPALQPDEEVMVFFDSFGGMLSGDTYKAVADAEDEVEESDETNNSVELFLVAGSGTPGRISILPTCTSTPQPTIETTPTPTPGPRGDANCDASVNSIDAALILQYEAAIIPALPCRDEADVNRDGNVNASDALLILQYVAGLIDTLPR